jgi:hypothetical protein
MNHESVAQMFKRYHADKKNGNKRMPLHTLQECCEEAGIDPRVFGRYAAQYPNAPQPVLNSAKNVARGAVKYYRKHEFVQWANQVRQQKEKVMPDIKTALEKALAKTANAWAADDDAHHQIEPQQEKTVPKQYFQTTNNVTRVTFDFVRDNPGMTRVEVARELAKQGYKPGSVSSLLGQMLKQGMLRESAHLLYATASEYAPLKSTKALKAMSAKPQEQQRKIVTLTRRTAPVAEPAPVVKEWSPNDVIDKLTVHQAIALFKALRNVLVG